MLGRDVSFWKLKRERQFSNICSLIWNQTIQFFSHESNRANSSFGGVPPSASKRLQSMIDFIRPISGYEMLLKESKIREKPGKSLFMPAINSAQKFSSTRRKASARTDILQFSNFKNQFVHSVRFSEDLFRLKLDLLSFQISFNLSCFLSQSSEVFSPSDFIPDHTNQVYTLINSRN